MRSSFFVEVHLTFFMCVHMCIRTTVNATGNLTTQMGGFAQIGAAAMGDFMGTITIEASGSLKMQIN